GLVVGPKEPCRVRYRKREQPSVTMAAAAELNQLASAEAMVAAHAGQNVNGNGNGAATTAPKKKLKITLDRDLCQGHAVCTGEAPDLFRLGDDGKVELVAQPELSQYGAAHQAEQYCPTRTIKVAYE